MILILQAEVRQIRLMRLLNLTQRSQVPFTSLRVPAAWSSLSLLDLDEGTGPPSSTIGRSRRY